MLLAATMAGVLASCRHHDEEPVSSSLRIVATAASSSETRAVSDGDQLQNTTFVNGNQIKVYFKETTPPTRTIYSNPYSYTVGAIAYDSNNTAYQPLTTTTKVEYPDNNVPVDVYALHPCVDALTIDATSFTIQGDQSNPDGYRNSDLMYAFAKECRETANNDPIRLQFKHVLSKVIVELVDAKGIDQSKRDGAKIKLYNVKPTIGITQDSNYGEMSLTTVQGTATTVDMGTYNSSSTLSAVIVPQDITGATTTGTKFIEIMIDGAKFVYYIDPGVTRTFKSGKKYTYKLTLKAGSLVLISIGIDDWETDDAGSEFTGDANLE